MYFRSHFPSCARVSRFCEIFIYMYILSGLWSLHSVHLYVFLVTWHFISFHTFMLSWSFFFFLVVYFVFHYSIVGITYRAVGCLWTFSRILWSQYF